MYCSYCGGVINYEEYELDNVGTCPHCQALILFTTDTEGVRQQLAEIIFDVTVPTREQANSITVVATPCVDTLLDAPNGEEVGKVHLVVAYDPLELLPTSVAARLMGITTNHVSRLARQGKLSGAVQIPPVSGTGQGRWYIPRHAIHGGENDYSNKNHTN